MAYPEVQAALQDPVLAMVLPNIAPTLQMMLDGQVNPTDVIAGIKQQFQNQPKVVGFMVKLIEKISGGGTEGMRLRYAMRVMGVVLSSFSG